MHINNFYKAIGKKEKLLSRKIKRTHRKAKEKKKRNLSSLKQIDKRKRELKNTQVNEKSRKFSLKQ